MNVERICAYHLLVLTFINGGKKTDNCVHCCEIDDIDQYFADFHANLKWKTRLITFIYQQIDFNSLTMFQTLLVTVSPS